MDNDKKLKDKETEKVSGGEEERDRPTILKVISYCQYCKIPTETNLKIDHGCLSILSTGHYYMRYTTDIMTCKVCGQKTEWWGKKMVVDGKLVDPPQ